MSCCSSCAHNLPCSGPQVGGFFSCDVDRDAFYSQKAPIYPEQFQRWIVALPLWNKISEDEVKRRVAAFLQEAGIGNWDYRAVTVLGMSEKQPEGWPNAKKVVSPIPDFKAGPLTSDSIPMLYVAIEFWYDGNLTEIKWPWLARGFVIQCPEDTLGGLMAVMPPLAAPAPPTILEETMKPLNDAAIEIHDGARDIIVTLADKMEEPIKEIGSVLQFLLWGVAGVLIYNVHRGISDTRKTLAG